MENKYFQPEISDIRVGYECEWLRNKQWSKYIIPNQDAFEQLYLGRMRVPYLTKEQIEAEGWNSLGDKLYTKMDDGHEVSCELHPINKIHIYYLENNEVDSRFFGECKDINTFRYISKLLGI